MKRRKHKAKWQGSALIGPRRYLFIGVGDKSYLHATHATIICLSLDVNKRFKLRTKGEHGTQSYQAAIIAPDVKHAKVCAEAGAIVLLYLMPQTDEAYQIKNRYLRRDDIVAIPESVIEALLPRLCEHRLDRYQRIRKLKKQQAEVLSRELDCAQAKAISEKIISALGVSPSTKLDLNEDLDEPVKTAIEVMDKMVSEGAKPTALKVRDVASEVEKLLGYEPKHLGEAFLDQVKVDIKHYKVGLGLRETLRKIEPGAPLRLLKNYFHDDSALNKACHKWLGVSLSYVSHYSYFRSCPE